MAGETPPSRARSPEAPLPELSPRGHQNVAHRRSLPGRLRPEHATGARPPWRRPRKEGMRMSVDRDEFKNLMRRVQEGSEDAARELLDRYGEHILRVVRRKLSRQLRSKFDSVD